jgi:hypothetical protein
MEIKVVTQQMLEILVSVARMPVKYRQIRREELIKDYSEHLTCVDAKEAFHALINPESTFAGMSERGRVCLQAVVRLAGRSEVFAH